jgi:extracellular factor (EF) 3-hydroxypalmitic acid methyl ester biosynthesis protein
LPLFAALFAKGSGDGDNGFATAFLMYNALNGIPAGQDYLVTGLTTQGLQLRADCLRLDRHTAVFEVLTPGAVVRLSEVLTEFKITLDGRAAYAGRAVVKNVVNAGLVLVCEVALEEGWNDVEVSATDSCAPDVRRQLEEYLRNWQTFHRIAPEFKTHLTDMQSYFTELRRWLEQVQMRLGTASDPDGSRREDEVAHELAAVVLPCIDSLFEKFELISQKLDAAARPLHSSFMRQILHPLLLCAPFAYRTFAKPLGYAGDYEVVNMIARNTLEGASLYARIVNLWFLRQPPAEAHRNRFRYLTRRLVEESMRVSTLGRKSRVLSLGCGPAVEVQDFVRDHELSNMAEITLIDFDKETLEYVTMKLKDVTARFRRNTSLHCVLKSVLQILKEAGRTSVQPSGMPYDFVYCAGLFDYLTDSVCRRLLTVFHRWLAPGGLLLVTNVEPSNPLRNGMEHLLDWHLIYRTSQQLRAVAPGEVPPHDVRIQSDVTGVDLFMEMRKPENA